MLDAIKTFLSELNGGTEKRDLSEDEYRLAAAALLYDARPLSPVMGGGLCLEESHPPLCGQGDATGNCSQPTLARVMSLPLLCTTSA